MSLELDLNPHTIEYKEPVENIASTDLGEIDFYTGLKIDENFANTRWFASAQAQDTFFGSNSTGSKKSFTGMVIKDAWVSTVKVPCASEALEGYDYCRFKAVGATRWTYGFVKGVSKLNPQTSLVSISHDPIQCCIAYWTLGQQSVERLTRTEQGYWDIEDPEKPNVNSILETGVLTSFNDYNILIVATEYPVFASGSQSASWHGYTSDATIPGANHGDTAKGNSSLFYIKLSNPVSGNNRSGIQVLNGCLRWLLRIYSSDFGGATSPVNRTGAIKKIMCVPSICAGTAPAGTYTHSISSGEYAGDSCTMTIVSPGVSGSYTRTASIPDFQLAPYNLVNDKAIDAVKIKVSARNGGSVEIPREEYHFGEDVTVTSWGVCGPNPSIVIEITSQRTGGTNYTENPYTITISGFPSMGYIDTAAEDIWEANMTAREVQNGINLVAGIGGLIASSGLSSAGAGAYLAGKSGLEALTSGPLQGSNKMFNMEYDTYSQQMKSGMSDFRKGMLGSAGSGMGILSTINNIKQTSRLKNSTRPFNVVGNVSGNDLYMLDKNAIVYDIIGPEIKELQAYDQYLTAFGVYYGGLFVNFSSFQTGLPFNSKNYCYLKTINANVGGSLGIYKKAVDDILNSGIRFWNTDIGTYV